MGQPVSYLQTDPRWGSISYSVKGESTTIAKSGCGPTAMAMVLATWADASVTPKTECAWALAHGYKALKQGTYYGYFPPAAKRYGLNCYQLNGSNLYGNKSSSYHAKAKEAVDKGNLVIAVMGPGNWTSSGHYVVVWKIDGDVIYINDPASTKLSRTQGSYSLFKSQVKYYWVIENPGKTTAAPTTKTETASKPASPAAAKVDSAKYFAKTYAKTYKVTASSLNMRTGAGTEKSVICTLPKDTAVTCYGYYSENNGNVWLYVIANGKTGFVSKKYLQ